MLIVPPVAPIPIPPLKEIAPPLPVDACCPPPATNDKDPPTPFDTVVGPEMALRFPPDPTVPVPPLNAI